jgi:predicted  nucleic acid-binding Zn-ribbon protein
MTALTKENRLLHVELKQHHMQEDLTELKGEIKDLRDEIEQLNNILSEKRGAINMRRTILYGIATFLSVCAAFGLHEYFLR